MLKFHFCSSVEKKIEGQSFEKNIRNKFEELSHQKKLVNTSLIKDYGNGVYVLKTFSPKSRIIIEEKTVNDINGFFIRDFITNKEYDYFGVLIHPKLKSGNWTDINPLLEKDKNNFIQSVILEKQSVTEIKKTSPPAYMESWLHDFKLKINYDVFESQDWVKYALHNSTSDGMRDRDVSLFRITLNEIIDNKNVNKQLIKEDSDIKIYYCIYNNIGIIFSEFLIDSDKVYVLYNGANVELQKEYWDKALDEIKIKPNKHEGNIDSVCRFAYRAYPKWTVKNDEQWFAIQKNDEMSNLSLTQEQIQFFQKFKFPYYINGQAGSGKSTMLYYLFANTCYFQASGDIIGDIIFLTENKELLKHTQKSVFDLLSNNPEFSGLTIEQKTEINRNFASFKEFLLDLLPKEDLIDFQEEKYLNFSAFKNLYENSHLPTYVKNNFSAEESWFTIITYIYGYDSSQRILSQEYESLVFTKSQKIPKDKFEGIEQNVLPYYEKLILEQGYWDKLKIIRYIEENVKINKFYSVVICDEAQDFCRVELRFILKMSEFLQYDLSMSPQVPIVFAGDPNQTVNPTGFRQGEMTDMLHNELKTAFFDNSKDESVYTPVFNYRSAQPVVNLANFIQFYRKKYLGVQSVKPQIAKREEFATGKSNNLFFNYSSIEDDSGLKEDLIGKIKYKIFIIPVDSHEKEEYVKNSSFLSQLSEAEIKTAVEAKGAEYGQVVLFGFGEHYLKEFGNLNSTNSNESHDHEFKKGYFFNKLYVGVTRAQNELIVIDNFLSEECFWKELINEKEIQDNLWKVLNDFNNNTLIYNPGTVSHVIASTPETALENAQKDKQQGLFDNNSSRLIVASNQFFNLKNKLLGYECLALAEKIKENWTKAGDYFLEKDLGKTKIEEAADCYFRGKDFESMNNKIGNTSKTISQTIRIIISKIMLGEKIDSDSLNKLNNNRDAFRELIKNIEWRTEFIIKFTELNNNKEKKFDSRDFVEILEVIATENDFKLLSVIADIHFNLKNYDRCIEIWNKIDFYDHEKYFLAQVDIAKLKKDFESEVVWLSKLHPFKNTSVEKDLIENEIIEIYNKNIDSASKDLFYNIAVYGAFLIQQPNNNIEKIGLFVETEADFELNFLLIDLYEGLLKSKRLNKKAAEFTIERWAKVNFKFAKHNKNLDPTFIDLLNEKYKSLSKENNIYFKEFHIADLNKISEFPEKIIWHPPSHIENINIINFRRFDNLILNDLGQFNLIVGDNNVGKTSLLEALLFSHEKNEYIKNLAFAYVERCNLAKFIDESKIEKYSIPNNFFKNFIKNNRNNSELQFIFQGKRSEWIYKIRELTNLELQQLLEKKSGFDPKEYLGFISQSDLSFIELPLILKNINPDDSIRSPLIPFGKGFHKSLSKVYSEEIDKVKSERNIFVENMKVFIPRIERIIVDTNDGEISIEETDSEVASPLHHYGEGAIKLFRILVHLTLQKGKRVLIDEIDAGIHFSRFPKFWSVILKFANSSKTQIFATTHNLECVKYFNEILENPDFIDYQDRCRVITLRELPDKSIKSYTRNFKEFEYELNNHLEIRGGDL